MEQQQQQQQQQQEQSQTQAYKRVIAENKRLKEKVEKLETELEVLRSFIGLEAKK